MPIIAISFCTNIFHLDLELEDSLSGSESSSESDAVTDLLAKSKITRPSSPTHSSQTTTPTTALVWFHSPPSTQIGIYRAIFPSRTSHGDYLNELKAMQTGHPREGRKWVLFMVAGGHFAGAVARVSTGEDVAEPRSRNHAKVRQETEVLRHKTFHRYTSWFLLLRSYVWLGMLNNVCMQHAGSRVAPSPSTTTRKATPSRPVRSCVGTGSRRCATTSAT